MKVIMLILLLGVLAISLYFAFVSDAKKEQDGARFEYYHHKCDSLYNVAIRHLGDRKMDSALYFMGMFDAYYKEECILIGR